jgi:hypothetical protein
MKGDIKAKLKLEIDGVVVIDGPIDIKVCAIDHNFSYGIKEFNEGETPTGGAIEFSILPDDDLQTIEKSTMKEPVCNCGLKKSEHNVRHPFIESMKPVTELVNLKDTGEFVNHSKETVKELEQELIKLTLEYVRLESTSNDSASRVLRRVQEIRSTLNTINGNDYE